MANREKVIRDCKWAIDQITVNGFTTVMTRGFFQDVISLLKQDEPHVLTLEEALNADVCWFESCTIYDSAYGVVYHQAGSNTVQIVRLEHGNAFEDVSDYGSSWRCWNRKPSEEQRRTAEWQE